MPYRMLVNPFRKSPFSGEFITSPAAIETNSSTYTWPAVSLGAEDPDRWIDVAFTGLKAASVNINSATINGVSATILDHVGAGGWSFVAHIFANVPTGTTGDIVLNFGGNFDAGVISVYRIVSPSNVPTISSDSYYYSASSTSVSGSPTLTQDSFVTAAYKADNANAITWTNVTENADVAFAAGNRRASSASQSIASSGALTISGSGTGSTLRKFHLLEWKK